MRGILAQNEGTFGGALFPVYQLQGIPDLEADVQGPWAVVLRDSQGNQLGRYPFEPEWAMDVHVDVQFTGATPQRELISFGYHVPDLPGVARIDLEGPNGLLDSLTYSANPPSVTITTPGPGAQVTAVDGRIDFAWTGTDPDGGELLYTTFYSANGGETWQFGAFEQTEPVYEMSVNSEASRHMVKVIATDGVRSTEAVVEFTLASQEQRGGGGCFASLDGGGKADIGLLGLVLGLAGLVWVRRRSRSD